MRYQANFLYLNLIYAVTLICFSYLFYFKIKNIFLTNFIVIAAAILLFTKLIYWYSNKSLQKFTKDTLQELGYEPDEYESCGKEVYIDFILKSNSPIQVQYG